MNPEKKTNSTEVDITDVQKLLSSVTPDNISQVFEMLKSSLSPEQLKAIETLMVNVLANVKKA
jgi:diketogulonate reductase-like aldo/keto reductase